mgnify:CR=1 FL=1
MINENKIRLYFFLGLLVIVTGIVALIFKPFLSPLLLAGALAVIFRPLYRRLSKTISWPSVSTLITVICILAIVVIPLTLLSGQLFAEATNFYSLLTTRENTNPQITQTIQELNNQINTIAPFINIDLVTIQEEVMSWLVTNFQFFFTGFQGLHGFGQSAILNQSILFARHHSHITVSASYCPHWHCHLVDLVIPRCPTGLFLG